MGQDLGTPGKIRAHEPHSLIGLGRMHGHRHRPAPVEADTGKF
jgi:hypothetical protein